MHRSAYLCAVRVLAVSDLHVDYPENLRWAEGISRMDYIDDLLILGGDISDRLDRSARCLASIRKCFREVFFVAGNHDLWIEKGERGTSLEKFHRLEHVLDEEGIRRHAARIGPVRIVPLLSWYDFSFGRPKTDLLRRWMDFKRCVWPPAMNLAAITAYFHGQNRLPAQPPVPGEFRISFSHFVPTLAALPERIDPDRYLLSPVLGAAALMEQVRKVKPAYHIFGHSHVNVYREVEDIRFVNNAYGYPSEARFTRKRLIELVSPYAPPRSAP